MPKVSMSKESLEQKPALPDGLYEIRLEGFEPKKSKSGTSTNLNPIIKVINHPTETGRKVFDNLNSGAAWIIEAFCHSFGLELVPDGNGGFNMPGDFNGPEDDPSKWSYTGPLTGCVSKAFLKQTVYNNQTNTKVDQWVCSVPNCAKKHPTGLAK
jgi:hypothetical protein